MDWIEQLLHIDPDGGSGTLELLILGLIVGVLVSVLVARVRANRRAPNS